MLLQLNLGIPKFVKLSENTGDWRKSRYSLVISSLKVGKYDTEQAIVKGLNITNNLGYLCDSLNRNCRHYSKSGLVNMTKQENNHELRSGYQTDNPRLIKQRSKEFNIREEAVLTGSTCNSALGLGKLEQQQTHYSKVILEKKKKLSSVRQRKAQTWITEQNMRSMALQPWWQELFLHCFQVKISMKKVV